MNVCVSLNMEEWKRIPNYPNHLVSNFGRIKSIDSIDALGRKRIGKVLKQIDNGKGYLGVCLKNGEPRKYVHRYVAMAFCIGYKPSLHVNHKDGNKSNNNADNLEWVSRSENDLHKKRNLEWHRYPILDSATGIFYANAKELHETFSDLVGVKYAALKTGISRNTKKYNRFIR